MKNNMKVFTTLLLLALAWRLQAQDEPRYRAVTNLIATGMGAAELSEEERMRLKLPPGTQGVLVSRVNPGSEAEKAGIRPDDVIVEMNGAPTGSIPAYLKARDAKGPGERLALKVLRKGAEETKTVSIRELKTGALSLQPLRFKGESGETDAEEGRLLVPENHTFPDKKPLEVKFVRFKSTAAHPGYPVVYLAGGPGGTGTGSAAGDRYPLFQAMRATGDVIAYDQRGTAGAVPALFPPRGLALPLDKSLYSPEARQDIRSWSAETQAHWEGRGVDLSNYHTEANADDLEMLRKALGAEKLNLWGISYGTHLALSYIRRYPDRVGKVILAGVEGPDHTYKLPGKTEKMLRQLDSLVKADKTGRTLTPGFYNSLKKILDKVEKEPVVTLLPGSGQPVFLGKAELQMLFYERMNEREDVKILPAALAAMEKGDYTLPALAIAQFKGSLFLSAMTVSMDCASSLSDQVRQQAQAELAAATLGDVFNYLPSEICPAWSGKPLSDDFRSPVKSEVPVLFISGTLDGRTPPENAYEVAEGFPNARHLLIKGGGHDDDLFLSSPAILENMLKFMKGEPAGGEIQLPAIGFDKKLRRPGN